MATATGCIAIAVVASVAGFAVPSLLPFTENVLAEVAGFFLALGIAIVLIEGRPLTSQARRREIVRRMARELIQDEGWKINMMAWELASWLGSELPEQLDVTEVSWRLAEENGDDWATTTRPALLEVFHAASNVTGGQIKHVNAVEEYQFRQEVDGAREFIRDVRTRLSINIEVREVLLELANALDTLEPVIRECSQPQHLRAAEGRMGALGRLGLGYIDFLEGFGTVAKRVNA